MRDFENIGKGTFVMAPFDAKYLTSYLMAIVMFALSLTVYETFANQEKCHKFDLENEGYCQGVEKLDLRHATESIFIESRILATWQHTFTKKDTYLHAHTHTHKHTPRDRGDDYRQNLQRRFA